MTAAYDQIRRTAADLERRATRAAERQYHDPEAADLARRAAEWWRRASAEANATLRAGRSIENCEQHARVCMALASQLRGEED